MEQRHEHVYGAEVTKFLLLSGEVSEVKKFSCIECGHKPNYKTMRKLHKTYKADPDSIPCDTKFFVCTEPGIKPLTYRGYYCNSARFNNKRLDRENGKF